MYPVSYTHLDVYKRQPCECRHDQRRRTLRSGISTHGILRGADSICKDGIPLKFLFQFAAPLGVCIEILSPKLIQYHKKLPSPSECRRRGVGKLRQYHDISIDCTMGVLTEVEEYPDPGTSSCMAFLYYFCLLYTSSSSRAWNHSDVPSLIGYRADSYKAVSYTHLRFLAYFGANTINTPLRIP